jgi:hypothetical protein
MTTKSSIKVNAQSAGNGLPVPELRTKAFLQNNLIFYADDWTYLTFTVNFVASIYDKDYQKSAILPQERPLRKGRLLPLLVSTA